MSTYFDEGSRQARELRPETWGPRQPCCGATNPVCAVPIRDVSLIFTACEKCGHSQGCHA